MIPRKRYPIKKGHILEWSGSPSEVPTGWALCDGTHNTPNLESRFITSSQKANRLHYSLAYIIKT